MDKIIITSVVILTGAFIMFGIYSEYEDNKKWKKFKTDHDCKIVEKIGSTSNIGIVNSPTGPTMVMISTPSKTAWKCNDGIVYQR